MLNISPIYVMAAGPNQFTWIISYKGSYVCLYAVCPRSSCPFYIETDYIEEMTTSRTYSTTVLRIRIRMFLSLWSRKAFLFSSETYLEYFFSYKSDLKHCTIIHKKKCLRFYDKNSPGNLILSYTSSAIDCSSQNILGKISKYPDYKRSHYTYSINLEFCTKLLLILFIIVSTMNTISNISYVYIYKNYV